MFLSACILFIFYQQLLQKDPSLRLSNVDSLKTHRYFEGLSFEVVLQKEVSETRRKLQLSPIYAFHAENDTKTEISRANYFVLLESSPSGKTFLYRVISRVRDTRAPLFLAPRCRFSTCCACSASRGTEFPRARKVNQRLVKAFLASLAGGYAHACGRSYSRQVVGSNERVMLALFYQLWRQIYFHLPLNDNSDFVFDGSGLR